MAAGSVGMPPGFIDLLAAKNAPLETSANIIGVVVDVLPAKCNRAGQWQVTFKLQDIKHRDSIEGQQGFTIRFFKVLQEDLPSVYDNGDIVLIRAVRIREWSGLRLAISNHSTSYVVFPSARIPAPGYATTFMSGTAKLHGLGSDAELARLSPQEQAYIISLKSLFPALTSANTGGFSARPQPIVAPPSNGRPSLKFKVIRELQHRDFADLTVEVVRKYPHPNGNCELYVTDYSVNKEMFYYKPPEEALSHGQDGDIFGYGQPEKRKWPGPFGWYVLKINLMRPHGPWANKNVKEGELVWLQNVKGKIMNTQSKLEGDMWLDDRNPERVKISHIKNHNAPEVRELLYRKDGYWTDRKNRGLYPYNESEDTEVAAVKPTGVPAGVPAAPSAASKSAKKRLKKKNRDAKKASKDPEADPAVKTASIPAADSNMHVRCGHREQTTSSFEDIIDAQNLRHTNTMSSGETYTMPFSNANYRTTARVVDFWPSELEDFVVLAEPDPDDKSEFSQEAGWASSPKWEWSFALQLEEVSGGETLWANVGHHEAQLLFGNSIEDPSEDLLADGAFLNKLREKLCILWGDLEEKKRGKKRRVEDKPSNKPFELCLSEYGMLTEDGAEENLAAWERQYLMHSVTIL